MVRFSHHTRMSGYHPIEAIAVGIANGRVNPNNVQTETVIRGVLFFNDPVPCPDPAERAVKMAMAMRESAGKLIADWRRHSHELALARVSRRATRPWARSAFPSAPATLRSARSATLPPGFVLRPKMGRSWSAAASLKQ